LSGKKGKFKWQIVAARYRFITSERQLYRFKQQIDNFGLMKDKLKQIWDKTLDNFKSAMNHKLVVHENDIRRWALKEASTLNIPSFKASS
jgi:hypothetical protein